MRAQVIQDQKGVCLIELMIALAAGMVVLGATLQSVQHLERRFRIQQETIARTQDLRLGLEVLGSELRRTGDGGISANGLLVADSRAVEFNANLDGMETVLTAPAEPGASDLQVADGRDWPRDREVVLCGPDGCVRNRLSRDGRRRWLSLETLVPRTFPAGSRVLGIQRVRYYLGRDQTGSQSLMRSVDGGANPLIGTVDDWHLRYLDREGRLATQRDRIVRLRVELVSRVAQAPIVREFALGFP